MHYHPFAPLPSPEDMNRWDEYTAKEAGIPPALLMGNAGCVALDFLLSEVGSVERKKILIFIGKGNNGGDGAVLARLAINAGAQVLVCHLHPLPEVDVAHIENPYASDNSIHPTLIHIGLARSAGVEFYRLPGAFADFPEPSWEFPDIVVDALLGTGFKGNLKDEFVSLVKRINLFRDLCPANCACGCGINTMASDAQWPGLAWPTHKEPAVSKSSSCPFVLSLDIPSGLCGLSGKPQPTAVVAHATITFEAPKPGLISSDARPYIGKMHVAPVGIPKEIKQRYLASQALLMPDCISVTPNPYTFKHKNVAGKVLIVGGSSGMSGAAYLAALGAFKAGAGRIAVACPMGLEGQLKAALPDMLTIPVGKGRTWTKKAAQELLPILKNWNCIVLGPGLGHCAGAKAVVEACINCPERGAILADADALTIIAENQELLSVLSWQDVITPHPGEAARILDKKPADIQENRLSSLKSMLKLTRATVILKGETSLIGQAGRIAVSPFVEPNLALAGSGDVLSGLAGAYLALGIPAFDAICAAVYLHGMAGRLLHEIYPFRGNLPSEIANILPNARLALADVNADWVPDLNDNKQDKNHAD